MVQSLNTLALAKYVSRQVNNFFPDANVNGLKMASFIRKAMARVEYCFSRIEDKYFFNGDVMFNHLHSDQYAMFLYYLSNTIWQVSGDKALAGKVYYLNKALHSVDAFYEVKLPDVFRLVHPVGTVLGRATYEEYFVAYQRVTVGGNPSFEYPTLGKGLLMYGGSSIIGKCRIGDRCVMALGAVVMEEDVPDDTLVVNKHFGVQHKKSRRDLLRLFFKA